MKIGDKVSFLSEKGGGKIAGFKAGGIVLVEDEDGFQIPMTVKDIVVIGSTDAYDMGKMVTSKLQTPAGAASEGKRRMSIKAKMQDVEDDPVVNEKDDDPSEREISFRKPVEERKGGNLLTAFIAFVPVDIKEITNTRFEIYLVNDSNYFMHYMCLMADGANWSLRYSGEIEPNTKLYLDEIGRENLNELNRLCVQLMSYKKDKPFVYKPAIDVQIRLDPVKFYKLHTFQNNVFFETPALLYTIVDHDTPVRPLVVDPKQLKAEMFRRADDEEKDLTRISGQNRPDVTTPGLKARSKDDQLIVMDLHADALLDTIAGMSPSDILNYQLNKFRSVLDRFAQKKGQKIVFIHGKVEGVLRRAIINDLNYRYKKYQYQDASFQEYGYGATQVTIK